jgi:hypothetical protein
MKVILVALGMLMVMAAPVAADPISISLAIVGSLELSGAVATIATIGLTLAIGTVEAVGLNYAQKALGGGRDSSKTGNSAAIDGRIFENAA